MLDSEFDKKDAFEKDIAPLADELVQKCEEQGVPILLHLVYKLEEKYVDLNHSKIHTTEAHFFVGDPGRMTPQMVAADTVFGNGGIPDSSLKVLVRALIHSREDQDGLGEPNGL